MKHLILTIIVLIILSNVIDAQASRDSIIIHSISHHGNAEPGEYNEINYTLGYEGREWSGGLYKDSYGTPALWMKRTWITSQPYQWLKVGYSIGVVTSPGYYSNTGLGIVPLILPEIRIGRYINLMILPMGKDTITGIQFKVPLGTWLD